MSEGLSEDGWITIPVSVPPELVKLGIAPDLIRFFDSMVYKLRRSHSKGRWETLDLDKAMGGLADEMEELKVAIKHGSTAEIVMESSDTANMALIVAAIALEARGAR